MTINKLEQVARAIRDVHEDWIRDEAMRRGEPTTDDYYPAFPAPQWALNAARAALWAFTKENQEHINKMFGARMVPD